jgi:hypothetical protein
MARGNAMTGTGDWSAGELRTLNAIEGDIDKLKQRIQTLRGTGGGNAMAGGKPSAGKGPKKGGGKKYARRGSGQGQAETTT